VGVPVPPVFAGLPAFETLRRRPLAGFRRGGGGGGLFFHS
jgi:hypothetical protein